MVKTIECLEREFDIKKNPLPDVTSNVLDECRPPSKRGRVEKDDDGDEEVSAASGAATAQSKAFWVKPIAEARGHTGFLTFACKTIKSFPESSDSSSKTDAAEPEPSAATTD